MPADIVKLGRRQHLLLRDDAPDLGHRFQETLGVALGCEAYLVLFAQLEVAEIRVLRTEAVERDKGKKRHEGGDSYVVCGREPLDIVAPVLQLGCDVAVDEAVGVHLHQQLVLGVPHAWHNERRTSAQTPGRTAAGLTRTFSC